MADNDSKAIQSDDSSTDTSPDTSLNTFTTTPEKDRPIGPNSISDLHADNSPLDGHESQLLRDLAAQLEGNPANASFCCGGTIPISNTEILSPLSKISDHDGLLGRLVSSPITLRWDSTDDKITESKVQFPWPAPKAVEDLLQSCTTRKVDQCSEEGFIQGFGRAGKLERSKFSINFHPHDHGILDAISQIMLPGIKGFGIYDEAPFLNLRPEHRGVVAELQSVEVLAGPTDMDQDQFHTIPRGGTQFGTLVVCLPYPHDGGELIVEYAHNSQKFDWSNTDLTCISWVAFHNDCQHKVEPMVSGYRITLTYNLYLSERLGSILFDEKVVDLSTYPLYSQLEKWKTDAKFFENGGVLGFCCQNKYPHNTEDANTRLPYALEGVDAVVYSIFQSFGFPIHLAPILRGGVVNEILAEANRSSILKSSQPDTPAPSPKSPKHVRFDLPTEGEQQNQPVHVIKSKESIMVGRRFQDAALEDTRDTYYEVPTSTRLKALENSWPMSRLQNVVMINEENPDGWHVSIVEVANGNPEIYKSHAAFFVKIPCLIERLAGP